MYVFCMKVYVCNGVLVIVCVSVYFQGNVSDIRRVLDPKSEYRIANRSL